MSGRRGLLGLGLAGLVSAAMPWRPAMADAAADAPTAPIEQLDTALLAAMRAGSGNAPFAARYAALDPVIAQVFDLGTVLAGAVGFSWPTLGTAQKAALAAVFRRYTVSTYVSNFDSYDGQSFAVSPSVRNVGNGEIVVKTQLLRRRQSPVEIDYVMRLRPDGWKVVDVLTDGSISQVAVQRSDFQGLLASGGATALVAGLERKIANLSSGATG
ncbi:MAG TPA: ABC transporter substrate-binding protein [Acetobacteraceae bacterium]|nr:ABC transporter substrate-binding protein [Acetobacteraceae bacterium]